MAVIVSKQIVLPSQYIPLPSYIITFTYDSVSSGGTIWASVTLPDGRVIHNDNRIESVDVSVGDTLRIFTISEKSSSDGGGVYVNGVQVMNTNKVGTYYDYTITTNATIDIDISQSGVTTETGTHTPAYKRGLVTITES